MPARRLRESVASPGAPTTPLRLVFVSVTMKLQPARSLDVMAHADSAGEREIGIRVGES